MDKNIYDQLNLAVNKWRVANKKYEQSNNKFIKNKFRVFGIHPIVFCFIFCLSFFTIDADNLKNASQDNSEKIENTSSELKQISNFTLYTSPDINSEKIITINKGVFYRVKKTTKYFHKVEFEYEDKEYSGYVLIEKFN